MSTEAWVTIQTRQAGSDAEWMTHDPSDRYQWQWYNLPDWLASEALSCLAEGCEVRLVSTGTHYSDRAAGNPGELMQPSEQERAAGLADGQKFGDMTEYGSLSLNSPGDDPPPCGEAHPSAQGKSARG